MGFTSRHSSITVLYSSFLLCYFLLFLTKFLKNFPKKFLESQNVKNSIRMCLSLFFPHTPPRVGSLGGVFLVENFNVINNYFFQQFVNNNKKEAQSRANIIYIVYIINYSYIVGISLRDRKELGIK